MSADIKLLQEKAKLLRKDIVEMVYQAKDGHPGPALSIADIVATLYFHEMRIDPKNPNWEGRDRLILSKGHACPAVYSALARKGFFSPDLLPTLRALHSTLQGHPVMGKTPGIDMTSGSLGNGLSIGLGMALASYYTGIDYNVFVIMGDGELQEGIVWEGILAAAKYKAGRLIVFVDENGWQSGDCVEKVGGCPSIYDRFESFGWHCQDIDGHDIQSIVSAIDTAKKVTDQPSLILAKTVKGKGVPYMENNNAWHKGVPSKEQYEEAMKVLG
ncbi:MAG: transketolase [Treponemataceae bacterium]